jgi:hypothetical protein
VKQQIDGRGRDDSAWAYRAIHVDAVEVERRGAARPNRTEPFVVKRRRGLVEDALKGAEQLLPLDDSHHVGLLLQPARLPRDPRRRVGLQHPLLRAREQKVAHLLGHARLCRLHRLAREQPWQVYVTVLSEALAELRARRGRIGVAHAAEPRLRLIEHELAGTDAELHHLG